MRLRGKKLWPILLLLVAVIVPTVSMLGFMLAAIDNERIAVRQRLLSAYRAQLTGIQAQLAAGLLQSAVDLDRRFAGEPCATVFATVVRAGEADSVICAGADDSYPSETAIGGTVAAARVWKEASRLERLERFDDAAAAFARIAADRADAHVAAQALQAQARCLTKSSRPEDAIRVLSVELARPRYRAARDPRGRLIAPNAQLLALQLVADAEQDSFRTIAVALHERLADYGEPVMPAPQRRFLMSELRRVAPDGPAFDTQPAEDLAAAVLNTEASGMTRLVSPSGRIEVLHAETALRERLMAKVADADLSAGATADLVPPGIDSDSANIVVAFAADQPLAGWHLALHLDEQALDAAATGRQTAYLWTGALVFVLIVAATALIAGAIRRQMRVTQLKNDLLATVSHELKTPLASMRLLVETLLDGRHEDPRRVREYLELIGKENERLQRLVENFLSFSRMERDRHNFERARVSVEAIVRQATEALGERAHAPGCRLEVDIAADLPPIHADPDAMETAILNLLDNAYKYTGESKQITLKAYPEGSDVCVAVRDNGIGLSSRERGKVFERFYQVDQRLSRHTSGCGLGLSIVRLIVKAHGGSVAVDSRPGAGSTFTIRIPAAAGGGEAAAREEALVS